jgi:hypothetical protein
MGAVVQAPWLSDLIEPVKFHTILTGMVRTGFLTRGLLRPLATS